MVSKEVSTWMIAKDLCRCCHAEGDFFNLATPNTFKDREEIYSDMLRTCFDIEIDPVPGGLCIPTYSICSKCVVKLREAIIFKEQVLKCEEKFYELLTSSSIAVSTQIKKEPEMDSEDYNDDMDDDLDDEMDDYIDDMDNDTDTIDTDLKLEPGEHQIEVHLKRPLRSRIQKTTEVTKIKAAQEPKPKPKPKPKKPPKEKTVKNEEKKVKKEKKKEDNTERKGDDEYSIIEESGDYKCRTCGKIFKQRRLFIQHYRSVHLKLTSKMTGCHFCELKVRAHLRAKHMEEKHGVPAPTCNACGRKFSYPHQVILHQKTFHMGEKNIACPVCDMKFGSKVNLYQHKVKHSTEKIHKCDYCDERFKWRKQWSRHMLKHRQN
ncbi:zinc finger protein 652-B-like isoform X5 [Pieris napi]|uniref:zinc finger protein 652-B-like isoform X5 n=1 Tax=Pieris napi TaxID=78633 RepID=UPI001FBA2D8E|nr:zinc finger protein 652-B-like isoform X5 [Pieris napi]